MTTISAALVKELRDKTGAGMMDCKTALTESKGDMEAASDWLRKKGITKAGKKSGRIAAEGLIGITASAKTGAVVEVNSETDFVARNKQFQDFVRAITPLTHTVHGDHEKLLAHAYPGTKDTVEYTLKEMIATIGENMTVRRCAEIAVQEGVVSDYLHNKVDAGLAKIGVLVALESKADAKALYEFGRQIAMHIAAASPLAVTIADLDPALVEKERQIYAEQAALTGKAPEIAAKMAEGRLKKEFFQQACLMNQVYVLDGKSSVEEIVKLKEKELGHPIKVAKFIRYALGEGIDKPKEDFAAEVEKLRS